MRTNNGAYIPHLEPGTRVRLYAYPDEIIERRVVEDIGRVVYICRDDEYEAAQQQNRKPVCVGFQRWTIESVQP